MKLETRFSRDIATSGIAGLHNVARVYLPSLDVAEMLLKVFIPGSAFKDLAFHVRVHGEMKAFCS